MRSATSVKDLNRSLWQEPSSGCILAQRASSFFTGSLNQSLIYHLDTTPYTALERQEDEEDSDCSRYAKGLY